MVGPREPAIGGALVDIDILQVHVHSHHTPAKQSSISKRAADELAMRASTWASKSL